MRRGGADAFLSGSPGDWLAECFLGKMTPGLACGHRLSSPSGHYTRQQEAAEVSPLLPEHAELGRPYGAGIHG